MYLVCVPNPLVSKAKIFLYHSLPALFRLALLSAAKGYSRYQTDIVIQNKDFKK